MIHMKWHLINSKKKKKKIRIAFAAVVIGTLRVKRCVMVGRVCKNRTQNPILIAPDKVLYSTEKY